MEERRNVIAVEKSGLLKKYVSIVVGVILIGIGIAWMRFANLGTDPFSAMAIGIASLLGISFWYAQMGALAALLVVVLVFKRKLIGIGTLINLISVGFVSDSLLTVLNSLALPDAFIIKLLELMIGIVVLCIGAAMYMNAELGLASYDALGLIVEERSNGKIKFKWARIFSDSLCVVIGFVLGSTIGIGTVATAFFTGPLVGYFRRVLKI